MRILITLFLLTLSFPFFAQVPNTSSLELGEIMKGEGFVGYLPTDISWSDDSKRIYFSWNPDNDTLRSTYQARVDNREISKLSFGEISNQTADGVYTRDYRMKVYERYGDIYLLDNSSNSITQITNTIPKESDPVFSGDEKSVIFRIKNNLYAWNISSGAITQRTNFKASRKKDTKDEGDEWLEQDQLAYFEILRKRKNEEDAKKYRDEQSEPKRPKQIYIGKNTALSSVVLSPDGKYVYYSTQKNTPRKNTIVPDFVTRSGQTTDLSARPKVQDFPVDQQYWIYSNEADSSYKIQIKDIPGIYDKPAFLKEYTKDPDSYSNQYKKPRKVFITGPMFSDDGKAVVNITSHDFKDRWIMGLDLATGKLKAINRQHDDAWIGGPNMRRLSGGRTEWIDNENVWFKSEETGYAHLYSANVVTGKVKALTSGDFEIVDVQLSRDKKKFYLTTNEVSPHEEHFYHMSVKGGKRTKITTRKGGHQVTVSPDEKYLAIRYAYSNQPWELYLMENKAGGEMVQLTNSTTDQFKAYNWTVPEIIRFKARDGVDVPASLYRPADDKKNGAAVIFVHGAGYLQNVHYWWPSYYREYMFHHLLADNGYTVLAVDFRASRGYGRDWRTAIYRHMGGKDLDDQVDGAKYLVEEHGIDAERVGIYGGSYGGFITLMAMFNSPETFKSGAALRSVTDWAHYNHVYTSRILNTPIEDSLAYARSSPIYFAEGLKGNLLMLHGMIDTNVQFQDVVRLSQRLIELEKENWELAVFPLEGHGFVESSSWRDEYRRIFELFQTTLLE